MTSQRPFVEYLDRFARSVIFYRERRSQTFNMSKTNASDCSVPELHPQLEPPQDSMRLEWPREDSPKSEELRHSRERFRCCSHNILRRQPCRMHPWKKRYHDSRGAVNTISSSGMVSIGRTRKRGMNSLTLARTRRTFPLDPIPT